MKLARFIGGHSRAAHGLGTSRGKAGAEVLGYPHPECFVKRGCKRLKTKEGIAEKSAKKRGTRGCKLLRTWDLPQRHGDTEALNKRWHPTPPPGVFVSAYSKGVTGQASVSAECKGLIRTKMVQNSEYHGSAESKGVRGAAGWRVCSR